MKATVQLNLLLLLVSTSVAQVGSGNPAEIRNLNVALDDDKVRIEVTVSEPVEPSVTIATSPDRLVLDLPGTEARARQRHIPVNQNGVKGVRVGLNSSNPAVTRVVVDLNGAHPYGLKTVGNKIILTVLPGVSVAARRDTRPAPAASGALFGSLLRRPDAAPPGDVTVVWPTSSPKKAVRPATKSDASTVVVTSQQSNENAHAFKVKYVAEGAAYLGGGRSSGLAEGMSLVVRDSASPSTDTAPVAQGPVVAELRIVSVADNSAVTEIRSSTRDVKPGDWAYLSAEGTGKLTIESSPNPVHTAALIQRRKPDESVRQGNPDAILPEDSRIRARIGLDYSGIHSSGATLSRSSQLGLSFRTDMTRIAGTHWNLQGYWRGRLTHNSQPDEDTLQDYLDKTYTIQLYYDNPHSKWVAGLGRLYLPWAISLDTIDGGYVGRRVAKGVTAGIFAGSTPDPTSWHYSPDRQIGGSFVNFEGGSYEDWHYTSTAGFALSSLKWRLDRPYLFLENVVSYRKYVSIYHSFIVDSPQGITTDGIKPGAGISRSYLTLHLQLHQRIAFDIYHNYFRDVPTAATQLIGTGLVDKLLYQGVNVGARVEPVRHIFVYATAGHSDKTGDAKRSLNQMYGLAWSEIWRTGIRADLHYSKFDSPFARGEYRVLSLSRHIGDRMMWDGQVGSQTLASPFTVNNKSFFVDTSFDTNLGSHSFLQSGYTIGRGAQMNYSQWYLSLGYRFDVRGTFNKAKEEPAANSK